MQGKIDGDYALRHLSPKLWHQEDKKFPISDRRIPVKMNGVVTWLRLCWKLWLVVALTIVLLSLLFDSPKHRIWSWELLSNWLNHWDTSWGCLAFHWKVLPISFVIIDQWCQVQQCLSWHWRRSTTPLLITKSEKLSQLEQFELPRNQVRQILQICWPSAYLVLDYMSFAHGYCIDGLILAKVWALPWGGECFLGAPHQ